MTEELDIIVVGFELDQSQVEAGIVRVFGIDPQQARRLLRELPSVAKSGATRALAERYVSALRSIGARVELRPTGSLTSPKRIAGNVSLPLPAPAAFARVDESLRVQREAARAIERFRAGEGMSEAESLNAIDPENPGLDLWNPAIPKAPLVPQDLARMRNAARSRLSDPPNWMLSEPPEGFDTDSERAHNDAQLPPPIELAFRHGSDPGEALATESRPSDFSAVRPRRNSVGLAHAATASIRPGLSPHYQSPVRPNRLRALWPLLVLVLLALAGLVYWLSDNAEHTP